MSELISLLEPGMLVRHDDNPEWGLGQVQSNIDGRVTVSFQEEGKVVLTGPDVRLTPVFLSGEG